MSIPGKFSHNSGQNKRAGYPTRIVGQFELVAARRSKEQLGPVSSGKHEQCNPHTEAEKRSGNVCTVCRVYLPWKLRYNFNTEQRSVSEALTEINQADQDGPWRKRSRRQDFLIQSQGLSASRHRSRGFDSGYPLRSHVCPYQNLTTITCSPDNSATS